MLAPSVDRDLPDHVDETVQAIARLRAAHARSATPMERLLESVMAFLGKPAFAGLLTLVIAGWIGVDYWRAGAGYGWFDSPPFQFLSAILALMAVYMMAVVLIAQRRAQTLADHREQLVLQLALVNDQKTAKLIALLEELRRDDPLVRDRTDDHAEQLTRPADPEAVIEAIRDSDPRAAAVNESSAATDRR